MLDQPNHNQPLQPFTDLVRTHTAWLYASALRQLRDPGLAEDAVQVVFFLLARKARVMKAHKNIAGWLFQTLGYTVKNLKRAEAARKKRERATAKPELTSTPPQSELTTQLDTAVSHLPPKYRQAILLRFYRDLSLPEIATHLTISEPAARKRLDRALHILRDTLGENFTPATLSASAFYGLSQTPTHLATSVANTPLNPTLLTTAKGVQAMLTAAKIKLALALCTAAFLLPAATAAILLVADTPTQTAATSSNPAFTPSKETTIITAPLHDDGTIDYVAALNARYSKDVTPQNNAFTAWMEITGNQKFMVTDKVRDKMFALSGANPASATTLPFIDFFEFLHSKGLADADPQFTQETNRLTDMKQPWKSSDYPLIAEWLESQKTFFDAMPAIWSRSHYWQPSIAMDGRSCMSITLVSLGKSRYVAYALAARALLRFDAGDVNGASTDAMTIERIGRHLSDQPTTIERLVGYGEITRGDEVISAIAASGKLTRDQCDLLAKQFAALPASPDIVECADIFERWSLLDTVGSLVSKKVDPFLYMDTAASGTNFSGTYGKAADIQLESVNWDAVLRKINSNFDDIIAALKAPSLHEMHAAEGKAMPLRGRHWDFAKHDGENNEQYTDRIADGLIYTFEPSFSHSEELSRVTTMKDQMTRTILAAAAYKADTGKWPDTLDQLVPTYLPKLPLDIYSTEENTPIHYLLTDKGILLYSVGKNGTDDGGSVPQDIPLGSPN